MTEGARRVLVLVALGVLAATVTATGVVLWSPRDDAGQSTVELASPPVAESPEMPAPGDPDTPAVAGPAPATAPDAAPGAALDAEIRPPEQTRIQILHNRPEPSVIREVVELLESFGYDVVWVNGARARIDRTTVYAVEGREGEAEALAARDPRLGHVAPNERFSTDVDLHVAIGPDWTGASGR